MKLFKAKLGFDVEVFSLGGVRLIRPAHVINCVSHLVSRSMTFISSAHTPDKRKLEFAKNI